MNLLEYRSPIEILHSGAISATRPRSDDEAFLKIVREVFDHQRAAYHEPGDADKAARAKRFYSKYKAPKLAMGIDPVAGTPVLPDEAYDVFFRAREASNRNNVSFLVGDVGVGKSSFLNWMITSKAASRVDAERQWFVRLDLERTKSIRGSITYDVFLDALATKIETVLKRHPEISAEQRSAKQARRRLSRALLSGSSLLIENALCELTSAIQDSTGRRFVLLIDNVDYLCHVNDESLFGLGLDDHEDGVITFLLELIDNLVNHQPTAGQLGANVLFVMRLDTLRLLRESSKPESHTREGGIFDEARVYSLPRVEWAEALHRRLDLLEEEVNATDRPGRRKKYETLATTIRRSLASYVDQDDVAEDVTGLITAPPSGPQERRTHGRTQGRQHLSDVVLGLSAKGLRELMEFLSSYAWISACDVSSDPLSRFAHHVPVGLLAYVLGGKRLYSEIHSEFPNVWTTSLRGEESQPQQCSFLLKRAILTLLIRSGDTQVSAIFNILGQEDGYPRALIEKALLDLADARFGRAIFIDRERIPKTRRFRARSVKLNERGAVACQLIFRRFFYLQLVVDDPALPIPLCLANDFAYLRGGEVQTDYRYVASVDADDYGRHARLTVNNKAVRVAQFLVMLEEAERCERSRFGGVFERLASASAVPISIPETRAGVRKELRALGMPTSQAARAFEHAEKSRSAIARQLEGSYRTMFGEAETRD